MTDAFEGAVHVDTGAVVAHAGLRAFVHVSAE